MKYLDNVPLSEVKIGEAGTEECNNFEVYDKPPRME